MFFLTENSANSTTRRVDYYRVLIDFFDGKYFKQHSLFSSNVSVPLLLYNDDCEIVKPLGSKVVVHKLGLIYFTIKSLPLKLQNSHHTFSYQFRS